MTAAEHVEDAERLLANVAANPASTTSTAAMVAQVHATLALAEQQRLGNLIALWALDEDSAAGFSRASGVALAWDEAARQISEGLGV